MTYLVASADGLASGTAVRNIALISFDHQTEIATNQVDPLNPALGTDPAKEALVTLDAGTPGGAVSGLLAGDADDHVYSELAG